MNNATIRSSLLILISFISWNFLECQIVNSVPYEKINPELLTWHWEASWITHPSESVLDYGVFHFRKSFTLDKKPDGFIIHISADNRYRLFVNGTPVCFGPARGDLKHWFFESIDIAPYLKTGENLVAAVVWNAGALKPWAQISLKTGLIIQGNGPDERIINTNESWKVIKNEAYSPAAASSKETSGQFVVVGPCDRVKGDVYPWGWENSYFNDSSWLTSEIIDAGHPYGVGTDVNWVMTPRRIPLMELSKQRFAVIRKTENLSIPEGFIEGKATLTIQAHNKIMILLDQGSLTTGYPELITSGGEGAVIKISYAESLFDDNGQKGNRNAVEGKKFIGYSDYFLPDGFSERLFRPLWFRTWRYIQLEIETGAEPLIINDFTSEFSAYPLKETASFDSDDETLKKIWNIGWRTARLCANETYFDCPYYEQLQYIGDTRIQAIISMYVSGDDRLARNALMQFDESRIPEGLTHSRYPTSLSQFIPPFSLYWIDMVHDYWMLRNDREFVGQFLPGISQVLNWYKKYIDSGTGLLGKVPYWNFVDWATDWPWTSEKRIGGVPAGGMEGGSSILTMQLAYAAERASELFRNFNMTVEADEYLKMASSLRESVYEKCWDESRGYIADTPEKYQFSMHAQIFAVLTNTIPEKAQKSITEKFMNDRNIIQPTMYFRAYLTQTLKKTGLADKYIETLGLWEEMIKNGLTTFAENPDPARSDCHAWSASPDYDMLATIAGIRPAEPGFRKVIIEPALGKLNFIKGEMPHPAGIIFFDLKRKGNEGITGEITLPDGLNGIFTWKGKIQSIHGKSKIDF
jgi:alpha-L-rhamnosidase